MPHPPHPLATLTQIISTPSAQDGISAEVEDDLRVAGCMMIQEAGIMLALHALYRLSRSKLTRAARPQNTIATAQVLFHRFFYVSSMFSFGITVRPHPTFPRTLLTLGTNQDISISSLYLSSKLNETPVRLRDLINTYILLSARIKFLLSLPADQPFPVELDAEGSGDMWRIGAGNGKGNQKERVWEGFQFEVPGFHDEVFWDCQCHEEERNAADEE